MFLDEKYKILNLNNSNKINNFLSCKVLWFFKKFYGISKS